MSEKIINALKKWIADAPHNIATEFNQHITRYIVGLLILGVWIFTYYFWKMLFVMIPIWVAIIGAVMPYSASLYYSFLKSQKIHKYNKFGVGWRAYISKGKVKSIEGPFCPKCTTEMPDKTPFCCLTCPKKYPAHRIKNGEGVKKIVEKIIEAEFRDGKLLSPNWSMGVYPSSSFNIKNNSASVATNVSIRLDLKINGETEVIGTYDIEDINPDGVGIIDNSDMMKDAHNRLDAMKFIRIDSMSMGYRETFEWGKLENIEEFNDVISVLKSFDCKFELNISYSLNGMNKTELYNYLLKFEHLAPGEYDNYYENNCDYDFHLID